MSNIIKKSSSVSLKKIALITAILSSGFIFSSSVRAGENITVYKNPSCGCCGNWVKHLEKNGFIVDAIPTQNRQPIQAKMGVPRKKGACHTAIIDGYFIEGHVPAEDIKRLLTEKPNIAGLAVPGMPVGSPGMENPNYPAKPYPVLAIDKQGHSTTYNVHGVK